MRLKGIVFDEHGVIRSRRAMPHRRVVNDSNARYTCRLLGARRERPRGRHAENGDELAPVHSITSSASASNLSGISRPSAFAVFRLMTNSNLVDWQIGRLFAFENATRVNPALAIQIRQAVSVT